MWTKALKIEGMTCPSCAAGIEKTLNQLKGVQIKVSYPEAKGDLKVRGNASLESLIETIEGKGYKVSSLNDHEPAIPEATPAKKTAAVINSTWQSLAAVRRPLPVVLGPSKKVPG